MEISSPFPIFVTQWKSFSVCRGKIALEDTYLSLGWCNTPKRGLCNFKNFVLDCFHAVEFQNVKYSSGVSSHSTNFLRSICFIWLKGTIENKRKGNSIRVCQIYQLCISCIYRSLLSPLTNLQLNVYSLHRCRGKSLVVKAGKILPGHASQIGLWEITEFKTWRCPIKLSSGRIKKIKREKMHREMFVCPHRQSESPTVLLPDFVSPSSILHTHQTAPGTDRMVSPQAVFGSGLVIGSVYWPAQ